MLSICLLSNHPIDVLTTWNRSKTFKTFFYLKAISWTVSVTSNSPPILIVSGNGCEVEKIENRNPKNRFVFFFIFKNFFWFFNFYFRFSSISVVVTLSGMEAETGWNGKYFIHSKSIHRIKNLKNKNTFWENRSFWKEYCKLYA